MQNNLIEIKNLSKKFSTHEALKNIHLNIPKGSIYGIIGMSGAGKSTLLRCLTGLETPTSGQIFFEGQLLDYNQKSYFQALRKQIGMVFQHFQLFSSRTVFDNVGYPLELAGIPKEQHIQRIDELLSLVGLEEKKHSYPAHLSGGEKQRVGIARALSTHPRLLLCDEPTSALDPKTTRDLLQLLSHLNQQLGLTVVIITHQLETVKQICQQVAVLAHGEIVEAGEMKEIFTRPQHSTTQHLLRLSVDQVPSDLLEQCQPGRQLVRLGFESHQAKQPVISQMIKRYDIEVNILSGGLDYLQNTVVGHLFVELTGSVEEIERSLAFLRDQNIRCEVLK